MLRTWDLNGDYYEQDWIGSVGESVGAFIDSIPNSTVRLMATIMSEIVFGAAENASDGDFTTRDRFEVVGSLAGVLAYGATLGAAGVVAAVAAPTVGAALLFTGVTAVAGVAAGQIGEFIGGLIYDLGSYLNQNYSPVINYEIGDRVRQELIYDSPSEGQTMRPGTPPHTIADARAQEREYANQQAALPAGSIAAHNAQEREYANSQGGRPSANPNDIHRDEGSRPGPGQTLSGGSGRGDGGSGSGSGPAPRSPSSHSGWGDTHGRGDGGTGSGSGSGGSTGSSGGGGSGGSGSSVTGGRGTPSPTTGGSVPGGRGTPSPTTGGSTPSRPSTPSSRNDPNDPGRVGPQPVVLDLNGNGFDISTLDTSNTFVAMDESGLLTRTAWARGQDGVLVIDANGDGKISSSKEFVFTEWASTGSRRRRIRYRFNKNSFARTDFEALKQVFDTNDNGKLDAGDARFGEFRVSVGGQLKTLALAA